MNDSFLEDLGLVEQKAGSAVRDAERYITTRRSESPKVDFCIDFEREIMRKQGKLSGSPGIPKKPLEPAEPKHQSPRSTDPQQSPGKRLSDPKPKKPMKEVKIITPPSKPKNSEKKVKNVEAKLKQVENLDKLEDLKTIQGFKSRGKHLGGSRESSRLSDGSSKENSRPSDSSGDSVQTEILKERRRGPDTIAKKSEPVDNASLTMLNAIKEIVSTYTKVESGKVMRMMQDLYINSQSNMIKQLMLVTDDLRELNLSEGSPRFQALVKENSQLLESVAYLRRRVDELQKTAEDFDKLKLENLVLRTRIRDLEQK
ncbi:uncharacterized protein LOC107048598 [Diachasma alloeum]|uniref:uncharacterized protein LOC107048598 n=1 Tax=Diachasma alloeum TaxID=454923 RepID=UPI0007381609|nr:uncharacterized protein LOC107048598 [Diachasma alloeum]